MNRHLERVKTWESLAAECRYSVSPLALRCGVSVRQLERYFVERFGQSPHHWLHNLRMRRAVEVLGDGSSAKETRVQLGYKALPHFSRDFKKEFGVSPSQCRLGLPFAVIPEQMSHFVNHLSRFVN